MCQVGAASDHDIVLLKGQLEEARAAGLSASRQWEAERQQLVASAQGMWAELQRCHEALAQTVGQVGVVARPELGFCVYAKGWKLTFTRSA